MRPETGVDQGRLVVRFKQLTEVDLPARARAEQWLLRLDHCFKRVCLDWACGDCWYRHIERPAERHADVDRLGRAVRCAEEILAADASVLQTRNNASLAWRGKLVRSQALAFEERRQGIV